MAKKKTELAETPIDQFEHGESYSNFIYNMKLGDIASLEDKYFTPQVSEAFDVLKYHLLDNKALRNKFVYKMYQPYLIKS